MEKNLLFLLFMVSLFMCTQAEATVMTYNGWAGNNHNIPSFIDGAGENYGSRISSSPVAYTGDAAISAQFDEGNGWTPNIELTWGGGQPDDWDTYTGWRGHEVAQVQGSSPGDPQDLVFTPDAHYGVLINSFDLDEWAGGGGCVVDWEVFDDTGTLASGTWTGNNAGFRSTVNTGLTIGDMTIGKVVTLRFMQTGGDGTYLAMDDTNFDQFGGEQAANPSPANEAIDVPREVVLSWTPGVYVSPINGHRVYFSESFDDVSNGVGGIAQDANSYTPPQRLEFETTYYWRVDEVNAPPDSTVYPGEVWSFTTEPVGYPIDGANITVTASSSMSDISAPEKTIDGSGLNDSDLHSTKLEDMWLSDLLGTQPTWIEYQFDKVYKLHEMWVWNQNQVLEGTIGYGFKDVSIEHSVDGVDYTTLGTTHEFARAPAPAGYYAHNTTVDLSGVTAKYVRLTANSNWGSLLAQYGLSEVRFLYIPVRAREPQPDSGAAEVDVVLDWRAGREATSHNVSFSADEQAVMDGTAPVTTVANASYTPPALDLASTYYWRVEEVNEAETPTTWQGDVWDFTTQAFIIVEDFESYNDIEAGQEGSNLIYETWADGFDNPSANGSTMGYTEMFQPTMESDIVHGGQQSAPMGYNNTAAALSEVTRTLAAQNWTDHGIQTLSLWFYGDPANTPGQLYVKINGVKVNCDGPADNLAIPSWQVCNIDLASVGTNLQSVTSLAIGVEGFGAAGILLLDDIGLYRLAPAPLGE